MDGYEICDEYLGSTVAAWGTSISVSWERLKVKNGISAIAFGLKWYSALLT